MESETEKLKKGIEEVHTLKVVDGRYSVKDKKLGEGSFAKTYLALDTKSGRVIACKMIEKKNLIEKINMSKNKSLTKEYFINALKNEVKTWKAINHTNIVDFIDFSETQNNIYFFLEFCSGGYSSPHLATWKLTSRRTDTSLKPKPSPSSSSSPRAATISSTKTSITATSKQKTYSSPKMALSNCQISVSPRWWSTKRTNTTRRLRPRWGPPSTCLPRSSLGTPTQLSATCGAWGWSSTNCCTICTLGRRRTTSWC